MKTVKNVLPHICVIMSGMFITFFIVDKFNLEMAFINNDTTKFLMLVFSVVSIVVSSMLIYKNRREE
jgi:hypothetical protein